MVRDETGGFRPEENGVVPARGAAAEAGGAAALVPSIHNITSFVNSRIEPGRIFPESADEEAERIGEPQKFPAKLVVADLAGGCCEERMTSKRAGERIEQEQTKKTEAGLRMHVKDT